MDEFATVPRVRSMEKVVLFKMLHRDLCPLFHHVTPAAHLTDFDTEYTFRVPLVPDLAA